MFIELKKIVDDLGGEYGTREPWRMGAGSEGEWAELSHSVCTSSPWPGKGQNLIRILAETGATGSGAQE